jgi:DNA-binding CsgD family transcriptional regulator/tetratricopeptide (TPR) repeat protein
VFIFDQPDLSTPLIARALHLEALGQALRETRTGYGRAILISGEAGVGKSRLLREFRASLPEIANAEGNCTAESAAIPYAPLIDSLRRCFARRSPEQVAELLGPHAGEIVKLLPELAAIVPGVSPTTPLEPVHEQGRLFAALTGVLTNLATPGPLLFILEDLHWADETTLAFLVQLARRLRQLPILLLFSARPAADGPTARRETSASSVEPLADTAVTAFDRFLAQMTRERLWQQLTLPPLSPQGVDALLQAMFDWPQPASRPLRDAIYHLTEGNPFFVEEVAGALAARGDVVRTETGWEARPITGLHIPHSLRLLVQQRLERLSAAAVSVLTIAAVAGRDFDFDLLAAITGQDEAALLAILRELVAARLVVEQADDHFTFRHALTREAIYSGLLARERRRHHRAIAAYLAAHGAEAAQLVAHYHAAQEWEAALRCAQEAGAAALGRAAPHAALAHFDCAATAAERLERPLPLATRRQRAQAWQTVGELDKAEAEFTAVLNAAQAADDNQATWQALLDLGYFWMARDYGRSGGYLQEALELARGLNDPLYLAQSLNRLGNWQANVGRLYQALPLHEEALNIFTAAADQRGLAATLDLIGTVHGIYGNIAASNAHYRRALRLFWEMDDRQGVASSLTMLAAGGDAAAGDEAVALCREIGWRDGEANAHLRLATLHGRDGRFDQALAHNQAGLAIAREIDHSLWQMMGVFFLGVNHFFMLNPDEAERLLVQALSLARESEAQVWVDSIVAIGVLTRLLANDTAGAAALLPAEDNAGLDAAMIELRYPALARAELALAQNAPQRALEIVEQVMTVLPDLLEWEDRALPHLLHVQGRALLALQRPVEAQAVLAEAEQSGLLRNLRAVVWRFQADLARSYLAERKRAEAETAVQSALTLIATVSATIPDAAQQAHFRKAAHAYLPSLPALTSLQEKKAAYQGLTRREREVAVLIAQGKTNPEIAAALFLSVRTVKSHVTNILNKLGFDGRSQIAAWVVEAGLRDN